jgi:hypothetical protein
MNLHPPDVGPAGLAPRILRALYRALFSNPADPTRHYPGWASW